ncbi:MAG: hypothetical protein H6735_14700 [Alphaproteobacteria bacterium]|nr:hypothetical protein [Alphaproteobacteria bacterium]
MSGLDDALDALPADGGTAEVQRGDHRARVDVVEADRLGVRIRKLEVERDQPVDVAREARELPERLRSLPDRVAPVEIAPSLGGARLRTRPDELRGKEYFEVDVEPTRTTVRRTRATEDGREPTDFTLTREQLERLIDEVGDSERR